MDPTRWNSLDRVCSGEHQDPKVSHQGSSLGFPKEFKNKMLDELNYLYQVMEDIDSLPFCTTRVRAPVCVREISV